MPGSFSCRFLLFRNRVLAIVPPLLSSTDEPQPRVSAVHVMGRPVRVMLVVMALGLVAVFATALWLDPYHPDGTARRMETHRLLGLPPCTFYKVTGLPCPSCGMTTSFALLVRGDVKNSLRANAVGTLMALFCLAFLPWSLASVARRRTIYVRSLDRAFTTCILAFLLLMLLRWGVVVVAGWCGTSVAL